MTAQFDDRFRHRGAEHSVLGIPEESLFDPWFLGLHAVGTCTACYRGYVATFALLDGRLVLDALAVNLYDQGGGGDPTTFRSLQGPPVNGVTPSVPRGQASGLFNNRYKGVAYPLQYTGGLMIADGFVSRFYNHTRPQVAWQFRTVIELVFEDGRLRSETDKSAEAAAVRNWAILRRSSHWHAGTG